MTKIISCQGLSKTFQHFRLDGINTEIPQGYVTGIIGPNGSGKTTFIKLILSLIEPDQGQIYYKDQAVQSTMGQYLQDVGIIMDEPILAKDWSGDDINDVMKIGYQGWQSEIYYQLLNEYGINPALKVKELSRGMTIKLMLAIALSHQANTLILDEPTSGLDPIFREELTDLLQDFVQDEAHSVVFSTHITADLEAIADYLIYIHDGQLIFQGAKDDLLAKYLLVKGPLDSLADNQLPPLVACKQMDYHFEALIESKYQQALTQDWHASQPSIDQIMIYLRRKHKR